MSREIRRVPVDFKHPTTTDTYGWTERRPVRSRLLKPGERFRALNDGFAEALADWESEGAALAARTGHSWRFSLEWHLTGIDDCSCHPGETGVKHPTWRWDADGESQTEVKVTTEDELHEYLTADHAGMKPDPAGYLPVFDQPKDELGWVLYETVSEGCPTTPVFATAEELIEHLVTVGEDYDQQPYRREAAERLVRSGSSLGSFLIQGNRMFDGARDLDLIEGARR